MAGRWHCHLEDGDHVLNLSGTAKMLKAHARNGRCQRTLPQGEWPVGPRSSNQTLKVKFIVPTCGLNIAGISDIFMKYKLSAL